MRPPPYFLAILILTGMPVWAVSPAIQLNVPYYADHTDQCGPATLAGLLSFWNIPARPTDLRTEMYDRRLHGTLPMDLVYTARTHGLAISIRRGDLKQVKSELASGRPVLALLNVGWSIMPVHHYVVITGYDDGKKGLWINSGEERHQFLDYRKFQKMWDGTDDWMICARAS